MPHRADDPLVAAASIVMALQTIVSRNTDPLQPVVITVGAFNAGHANNVIPTPPGSKSACAPSTRQVRRATEARIKALVTAQAESFNVPAPRSTGAPATRCWSTARPKPALPSTWPCATSAPSASTPTAPC
jgi:metal-dependent amidase/aminoacylase/carboxypeptidase family protein